MTEVHGSTFKRQRYADFRSGLSKLHVGKWFIYHRGSLAVARAYNREVDLVGRLTYGLHLSGACILMQWRDPEGSVLYGLWPTRKLQEEDLVEAMTLNPPPSKEAREFMAREG